MPFFRRPAWSKVSLLILITSIFALFGEFVSALHLLYIREAAD